MEGFETFLAMCLAATMELSGHPDSPRRVHERQKAREEATAREIARERELIRRERIMLNDEKEAYLRSKGY